ncbi:MAG: ABC transporter ATP-binding protein [Alphaproteobacteria bacterium]|nr:ABC transporter ATP-binding protein [Alphaproteobacteria bacterium]
MNQQVKPILDIKNLTTQVNTEFGAKTLIDNISLSLFPQETLCIAGESGSGKSVTALSVMGLLPPAARITNGALLLNGENLLTYNERQMQRIRGGDIAMIFQEPMTSLNPLMTIGSQLSEAISAHNSLFGSATKQRALELMDAVRLSEGKMRLKQYPHELSGGMRQRVMIAMALVSNPKVLIADEPTTALDVTVQAQILALMNELKADFGTSIILITHDMGVVAEMADRVAVMKDGKVIETSPVDQLFAAPKKQYTQTLLAAVPLLGQKKGQPVILPNAEQPPILSVKDLTVRYDIKGGLLQRATNRVHAVEKVSFNLFKGETFSLVGESGCGKSTIGKSIVNLTSWQGSINIDGQEINGLPTKQMNPIRQKIQLIFQDPGAALNPRMTVGDLVGEPLLIHKIASGSEVEDRVADLFTKVGLSPEMMTRHPHEFSGGQRQRICIARALCLNPKVIIADESLSALDVSVQKQVIELLQQLQDEMNLSYLFISHDMAVVEQISHRVAVMYLGQIVETGTRAQIFENPQHIYTKRLLNAVPIADPTKRHARTLIQNEEIPSPIHDLKYIPQINEYSEISKGHFVATYQN